MSRELAYREACIRADQARAQLQASASEAKARIAPARLAQDAKTKATGAILDVVAKGAAKAQQRPIAVGAAATAFTLFLARRPLAALFRRLYVRLRSTPTQLPENDHG
ncbi:hypothetical protein [Sphingobium sp. MK2]|uniref:hypothetical protein n=1 Tax=Sphingobium sp. MK2 TaxID=3116540 RepID=UPI0032E361F1